MQTSATAPALLNHRDVVNAGNAGAVFCLPPASMQSSLRGIANKAAQNKTHRFQNLYRLLTLEFLLYCWRYVNKKAASGVDRINAVEYALNLNGNALQLAASVKGGWYRAK